jgi:serine/threonine protein kinase
MDTNRKKKSDKEMTTVALCTMDASTTQHLVDCKQGWLKHDTAPRSCIYIRDQTSKESRFVCIRDGPPIAKSRSHVLIHPVSVSHQCEATTTTENKRVWKSYLYGPHEVREWMMESMEWMVEVGIMLRLSHPHICSLQSIWMSSSSGSSACCLEMNKADIGFLRWVRGCSTAHNLELVRQAITSVRVLHDAGFMHRDLKPHNFLLYSTSDSTFRVELCDFGTAALFGHGYAYDHRVTTHPYVSPELLECHVDWTNRRHQSVAASASGAAVAHWTTRSVSSLSNDPDYDPFRDQDHLTTWYDERTDIWSLALTIISSMVRSHEYLVWSPACIDTTVAQQQGIETGNAQLQGIMSRHLLDAWTEWFRVVKSSDCGSDEWLATWIRQRWVEGGSSDVSFFKPLAHMLNRMLQFRAMDRTTLRDVENDIVFGSTPMPWVASVPPVSWKSIRWRVWRDSRVCSNDDDMYDVHYTLLPFIENPKLWVVVLQWHHVLLHPPMSSSSSSSPPIHDSAEWCLEQYDRVANTSMDWSSSSWDGIDVSCLLVYFELLATLWNQMVPNDNNKMLLHSPAYQFSLYLWVLSTRVPYVVDFGKRNASEASCRAIDSWSTYRLCVEQFMPMIEFQTFGSSMSSSKHITSMKQVIRHIVDGLQQEQVEFHATYQNVDTMCTF